MDQHQENKLETLLEQLGSLRITEKDISNKITEIETTDKILIVLVPAVQNKQTVMPKSIFLDPG